MVLKILILQLMSIGLITVPIKAQDPAGIETNVAEMYMLDVDKAILEGIWNIAGYPMLDGRGNIRGDEEDDSGGDEDDDGGGDEDDDGGGDVGDDDSVPQIGSGRKCTRCHNQHTSSFGASMGGSISSTSGEQFGTRMHDDSSSSSGRGHKQKSAFIGNVLSTVGKVGNKFITNLKDSAARKRCKEKTQNAGTCQLAGSDSDDDASLRSSADESGGESASEGSSSFAFETSGAAGGQSDSGTERRVESVESDNLDETLNESEVSKTTNNNDYGSANGKSESAEGSSYSGSESSGGASGFEYGGSGSSGGASGSEYGKSGFSGGGHMFHSSSSTESSSSRSSSSGFLSHRSGSYKGGDAYRYTMMNRPHNRSKHRARTASVGKGGKKISGGAHFRNVDFIPRPDTFAGTIETFDEEIAPPQRRRPVYRNMDSSAEWELYDLDYNDGSEIEDFEMNDPAEGYSRRQFYPDKEGSPEDVDILNMPMQIDRMGKIRHSQYIGDQRYNDHERKPITRSTNKYYDHIQRPVVAQSITKGKPGTNDVFRKYQMPDYRRTYYLNKKRMQRNTESNTNRPTIERHRYYGQERGVNKKAIKPTFPLDFGKFFEMDPRKNTNNQHENDAAFENRNIGNRIMKPSDNKEPFVYNAGANTNTGGIGTVKRTRNVESYRSSTEGYVHRDTSTTEAYNQEHLRNNNKKQDSQLDAVYNHADESLYRPAMNPTNRFAPESENRGMLHPNNRYVKEAIYPSSIDPIQNYEEEFGVRRRTEPINRYEDESVFEPFDKYADDYGPYGGYHDAEDDMEPESNPIIVNRYSEDGEFIPAMESNHESEQSPNLRDVAESIHRFADQLALNVPQAF